MRPLLKICGLMTEEDVALCCRKGVEICGFVTEYPVPVPWNLSRDRCAELLPLTRGKAQSCIVTGGELIKLRTLALRLRPDLIQLHGGESLEVTAALAEDLAPLGFESRRRYETMASMEKYTKDMKELFALAGTKNTPAFQWRRLRNILVFRGKWKLEKGR